MNNGLILMMNDCFYNHSESVYFNRDAINFRDWVRQTLSPPPYSLLLPVDKYITEIWPLEHPSLSDVFIIGGLVHPDCSTGDGDHCKSVTGAGFNARDALFACIGEAAEYLSHGGLENLRLKQGQTDTAKAGGNNMRTSSNGLGAGINLDQARLHGTLELIERHEVLAWWLFREKRPAIDPARIFKALGKLPDDASNEWSTDFLLLTQATGIPVVAALSRRGRDLRVATGFKAALSLDGAIRGAYLEMRACRFSFVLSKLRDQELPVTAPHYPDEPCLAPTPKPARWQDFPVINGAADLAAYLSALGFATSWIDLTDQLLQVPVCRVISGRLQDPNMRELVPSLSDRASSLPSRPQIY